MAQFVLDGLQSRLSLLVGRQEMEAEAEKSFDTTWLRHGNLACRLSVSEEEEEEGEGEMRVELRAR